jgi:predicted CopG family antitoxin
MKERVTFFLEKELVKKFKQRAIAEEKSFSELVEELMKKKLGGK